MADHDHVGEGSGEHSGLTTVFEGELFATENGPDIDFPEEINWIREGLQYGFPWRFGAEDNPVLDPTYDGAGATCRWSRIGRAARRSAG